MEEYSTREELEKVRKSQASTGKSIKNLAGDFRLNWPTRFAYASGDVACNIVFGMVGSVLTLFYTDYVGANPAIIGLIFLLTRIFDGVSDLIMGFIVERTKSRWGKARPWILWMSVPFSISAILLFTVPKTTETMMYVYIFVTYFFCNTICYTAINLPYGSLSSMMTRNAKERQSLSIVRMGMSPIGKIISVTFTLPLVTSVFGNNQMAWVITMSLWVIIGQILLLICFFKCKENVQIPVKNKKDIEKVPIVKGLKALVRNQYFWAVLILWMIQSVSFSISGTILPYYSKYILSGNAANWSFNLFGMFPVDDASLYSVFFLTETITLVVCIFLCAPIVRKLGKRNTAFVGAIIAFLGQFPLTFMPDNVYIVLFTCFIRGVGLAPLNAVVFGMVGDAIEFGQWKTHVRQEGLVFAGGSIGTKVGAGLASAVMTGLLSMAGYLTSTSGFVAQPESAIWMIGFIYFIGPLIIAGLAMIVLGFYRLDKKYDSIMIELADREAKGQL